jgi:hypothetical protein
VFFFFFFFADYIPVHPHPALDTGISSQPILLSPSQDAMHTFCHISRALIHMGDVKDPFARDAHHPRGFSSYLVQLFLSIPSSIFTPNHPAALILGDRRCLDRVGLDILTSVQPISHVGSLPCGRLAGRRPSPCVLP